MSALSVQMLRVVCIKLREALKRSLGFDLLLPVTLDGV